MCSSDLQSVNLNAVSTTSGLSYNWTPTAGLNNPSISSPSATPSQSTIYTVTITDALGCSNTDTVSVIVQTITCNEPEIYIPNAFTPNGDQNNDRMYVRGNTIRELTFRIYNRWGEKVFESNSTAIGWDGTVNGKAATPAVYTYYVEAICYDNQRFFKKGNISLIR